MRLDVSAQSRPILLEERNKSVNKAASSYRAYLQFSNRSTIDFKIGVLQPKRMSSATDLVPESLLYTFICDFTNVNLTGY